MSFDLKLYKFGIIGGDRRVKILADIFKDAGCDVKIYDDDLNDVFSSCNVLVLPVPVSKDKLTVFSVDPNQNLLLSELIEESINHAHRIIVGGVFPYNFSDSLMKNGHTVIDLFDNEELIFKNAVATAEGALMTAMEKIDVTVTSTSFAVIGYGRIASYLCKIINSLGGKISVFARNPSALSEAMALGYQAVDISDIMNSDRAKEISDVLDSAHVIFNTVPNVIINRKIIERMRTRPLYIELASLPYGIDVQAAREMNFNILYAPSLPGRYSPKSAAGYIFETIINCLKKADNG